MTKKHRQRTTKPKRRTKSRQRDTSAETTALVPTADTTPLGIIERIVKDKSIDVGKFAELVKLQEHLMTVQAKIDFERAFNAMHPRLPIIRKRGIVTDKQKNIRSRYARLGEDIQPIINPILAEFGFTIRFRTSSPSKGTIHVEGILTHIGGHSEMSAFEGPEDVSDFRSHIQSLGSTRSYGRRYTTVDLLNLTVQGEDDDGNRGLRKGEKPDVIVDAETGRVAPDAHHRDLREPITESQRGHVYSVFKKCGRAETEFRMWLKKAYGIDHTAQILRKDFEAICAALERPGPLPLPRTPGEEG